MKIISFYIFILLNFFWSLASFGQTDIKGTVIDKVSHRPLPFVNIVYSKTKQLGTTSDLDGRFHITYEKQVDNLELSFIGYKTLNISLKNLNSQNNIIIKLEPETFKIPDVDVYAKENPAHRIINNAIKNRKKNNPETLATYQYQSYNKMFFTFDVFFYRNGDTLTSEQIPLNDTINALDSNLQKINKLKENQYLFLMESVTEKKYKRAGKVNEKIIASRVSGIQNPTFALIGTQLQSFTIYSDYISILGKTYLSPLSKNSCNKYLFIIEDTLINTASDTTYTLSYRPRRNKNFDGLEGILQINTKQFAVENFSTTSTEQEGLGITIRQKYEAIQDSIWFPKQLDADIIFKNILFSNTSPSSGNKTNKTYIYGKSKTYIQNIQLNRPIKNREFSHIAVDYQADANRKDNLFWNRYRIDSISQKELNTYRIIDSLGDVHNFENKLRFLTYLSKGEIPVGPLSIHLNQIIDFNVAEGFRLGLGLSTNDKISKNATLGGYGAYSFGDDKWKYGGHLKFNLRDYFDSYFDINYQNDVIEEGGFSFLETNSFLTQETYRDYLIKNIVYEESAELAIETRFAYYLKTRVYTKFSRINYYNPYYELAVEQESIKQFEIPEVGLQLRYAYFERYIRTPMGMQALKSNFPVVFFNISKSIPFENYTLDYTRLWGKIEKRFTIRNAGISSISLQAGLALGELPYHKLYNGRGSYYPFSIVALNSFGTMRLNEFMSNQFIYFFYRHNFGKLIFKSTKFQPEFSIVQNMGWGKLNNPKQQTGISYQTLEKGYYESGLVIDNLFSNSSYAYGVGVYYRYGPYALSKTIDNFAFKLSLKIKLFSE